MKRGWLVMLNYTYIISKKKEKDMSTILQKLPSRKRIVSILFVSILTAALLTSNLPTAQAQGGGSRLVADAPNGPNLFSDASYLGEVIGVQQALGPNVYSTFNGSKAGWSAVAGKWSLYKAINYRSAGIPNSFASAKHTGLYSNMIYQVKMKRTGTCLSSVHCGNYITIRGTPTPLGVLKRWNKEYKFAYSNTGEFSVWKVNGRTLTTLKNWKATTAIKKNGWNTLKVIAIGNSLKFYINNVLVYSGKDATLKTGMVGFGFYRGAAPGILYVDWARLTKK
jgi:hypothetical protein